MSNVANNGTLIGRLARDPKVFTNSDGSKTVMFTVYANRNYKNAHGEALSDAVPVEAFIRKETDFSKTPFANIHKGDQVALNTTLRMNNYERDGETIYDLKVVVEDITFMESLQVTQARLAERVNAAEKTNQELAAVRTPVSAPVPAQTAPIQEQLPFG